MIVRFRIDGVLRVAQRVPRKFLSGMVTRLKVLAKLDIAERRKPQDGRISLDAAAAGRLLDVRVATLPTVEGESVRCACSTSRAPRRRSRSSASPRRCARSSTSIVVQADRRAVRHRADRLRKVDVALRSARRAEPARDQRDHGRGPGRVPPRRHRAGADQPARRADVLDRAALDPPLRPGRGDGRRDPRRRDREDLDRVRAHRSLRAVDDAHQRRAEHDHAPQRDGRRAVPDRVRDLGGARPAPRPQALHELRRGVPAGRSRPSRSTSPRGAVPGVLRRLELPPRGRLPALLEHRLSRPGRHLPAAAHERRDRVAGRVEARAAT